MPRYLQSEQIIPNKGMSYTMYEIEDVNTILRMLTWIPDADQISIYPKPPVKQLFAPERCAQIDESQFLGLWQEGENRKK
ncbi:MAG TPA: hypothetical protein PKE49_13005 [Leptospiraceae bacterium]|jgi:hypothetical protein|nr:hypothetical protein [Leptospirales bacterium]HMU83650.1 hypothetical protein [Leptospiraceae bacterium]HMX57437.1 hypothetical protein [Leptospiraceae bacterium]HMY45177.1 hypothetical protein [Leptospiraceae bacterium]HMZ38460.1 hypothetical protein [Leptospiraceae bacterium]